LAVGADGAIHWLLLLPAGQVLGLTNYSHWDKAAAMRSCMVQHEDIAGEALFFFV
jgi:hypothetical protein